MVRTKELAAWRTRRGINQEQAGAAIGCSKNTYNLKENNKSAFSLPEVMALISLLGIERDEDKCYIFLA